MHSRMWWLGSPPASYLRGGIHIHRVLNTSYNEQYKGTILGAAPLA